MLNFVRLAVECLTTVLSFLAFAMIAVTLFAVLS